MHFRVRKLCWSVLLLEAAIFSLKQVSDSELSLSSSTVVAGDVRRREALLVWRYAEFLGAGGGVLLRV